MNVKISVFVICAEAIYLLLHNLHDCTLKNDEKYFLFHFKMVKHAQTIEKYFYFHPQNGQTYSNNPSPNCRRIV